MCIVPVPKTGSLAKIQAKSLAFSEVVEHGDFDVRL